MLSGALHGHDDRRLKSWNNPEIPPTGKSFAVDFYTVAQWDDGQIVEENLMYDLVSFLRQLGLD